MARSGFSKKISMVSSLDFPKNRQNVPYKAKSLAKKNFNFYKICIDFDFKIC